MAQIPVSTVVAVGQDAFVITDGTSNIAVYGAVEAEIKVGDTVMIVTTHTGFNDILDILSKKESKHE